MNFEPVEILTNRELEEFREKTTRASREKWKRLRAEGMSPTVIRLGCSSRIPLLYNNLRYRKASGMTNCHECRPSGFASSFVIGQIVRTGGFLAHLVSTQQGCGNRGIHASLKARRPNQRTL